MLTAESGSTLNISGGAFASSPFNSTLTAEADSNVNLVGSEFSLNGAVLDLEVGVPTEILDRHVGLAGRLVDGNSFWFSLDEIGFQDGFFAYDATLTLTLVPTPGDYNGDGVVDATDADAWRSSYGASVVPFSGADGNGNGVIDTGDYAVWRQAAQAASAAVPEPSSVALVGLLAAGMGPRWRRFWR